MTDFYRWQHLLGQIISRSKLIQEFMMLSAAGKRLLQLGMSVFLEMTRLDYFKGNYLIT